MKAIAAILAAALLTGCNDGGDTQTATDNSQTANYNAPVVAVPTNGPLVMLSIDGESNYQQTDIEIVGQAIDAGAFIASVTGTGNVQVTTFKVLPAESVLPDPFDMGAVP